MNIANFDRDLIIWGKANFRAFPWRLTTNPYNILIAEIMLHRTHAKQVCKLYQRFIDSYPDVQKLAMAREDEIELALYSLGLHWRVRLIRKLAEDIVNRFSGNVPTEKDQLISLPGVSEYIASAVRCFALNLPEAIIDTNTIRVVGRVRGLDIKDSSRRNPVFRKSIEELVDKCAPKDYNYALLDLASLICTKRTAPIHCSCPVQGYCRHADQVEQKCE